jgi:hypothetical protein
MGLYPHNQYNPSVRFEDIEGASNEPPTSDLRARVGGKLPASGSGTEPPSASSDPEVMEISEDLVVEPDPLA